MPYQRIVCFRFKPNATSENIQRHMDAPEALKGEILQIVFYNGGRTVPLEDGTPPEYDSMHYLTFESQADIAVYFRHLAHQRFIEENKGIWDKVFVENAAIDE